MTQLNFNASTVAPRQAMDPIPSGWYRAIIEESKSEPTSKPGGMMLALTLKIIDGEFTGRKVFDRLNLQNENPTTVQIAYETLSQICHSVGVIQCQDSQQLHNIPLLVKVKLRPAGPGSDGKHYDASNEVKGYDHINADRTIGPASGGATAGGFAGAPQGTTPWAAQQGAQQAQQQAQPAAFQQPAQVPQPAHQPPAQPWQPPAAQAQPWQPQQPAQGAAQPPAQPFQPPQQAAAPAFGQQTAQPAGPVMLPGAGGVPYESWKAQGWPDEELEKQGKFSFPQAQAPAPAFQQPAQAPSFQPQQQAPAPASAPAQGGAPLWAQRPAG